MRRRLTSYAKRVGRPPGDPVYTGKQHVEQVLLALTEYTQAALEQKSLSDIISLASETTDGAVRWLNIVGLHDLEALEAVRNRFGMHPLVIEDIVNTQQRPKIDAFDDYLQITLKMVRVDDKSGELDIEQLSIVLGSGWLLTFQERPGDVLDPVRKRIEQSRGRIRTAGADYLAYALVDAVVDHYFLVLEHFEETIESLEDEVLCSPDSNVATRIHHLKRELLVMKKSVWPLREMLSSLLRDEHPLFAPSTAPYLRDVYDHVMQAVDTIDTFREMTSGLLDMYLSNVSNRMNEVMKVLTVIATIFIPLSFLAGVYGMNFDFMPELHLRWGYYALLGVCAVVAGGMLIYFRRKKWL